jgi:Domain of unknown function (DUF4290)
MKEYGTNVQKLVDYIMKIDDKDKRTKYAYLLTELMRQVHPNMRDGQDYTNKLWDDLFIMSEFKLDVDTPFAPPPIDAVGKRPKIVPYNLHNLRYKHYGHNVVLLIEKAINTPSEEEQNITVAYICRLMKSFYTAWNKEIVEEAVIYNQLDEISKGKLRRAIEVVKNEGVLENSPRFNRQSSNMINTRNNFTRNTGTSNMNNRPRTNYPSGGTGMNSRNMPSRNNYKGKV